jgi:hypothetical protein
MISYTSAIGSIMYAMICTCPDVSYALSGTNRYQSNYGEATKEVVWIKNFVSELGVVPSASSPMDLYCDNSGVIA